MEKEKTYHEICKDVSLIAQDVVYVGMANPGMRTFDIIMRTEYGTTYNSYLIMGEKNVLIETAHHLYTQEYLDTIKRYIPIEKIDYIILNHTEPDHSGSLEEILNQNPGVTVIGTTAAIKNLGNITNRSFESRAVKAGDTLDIGNGQVFEFIIAPNLHWPDSMFTYYGKEKILFSCDFFGSHYYEQFLYDDQLKRQDKFALERKNYFDCIFSPFKKFVRDGLSKIEGIDIAKICCSHGPILRSSIEETIALYRKWSEAEEKNQDAAIFYVSAYGYTKKIAKAIQACMEEAGVSTSLYDLLEIDMEKAAAIMNRSGAVLFGSPTINGDALEPVWNLINATVINSAKGKPALVFGSFGWSGEACQFLNDRLKGLKYNVFPDNIRVQFNPSQQDMEKIRETMAEFIKCLQES